MTDLPDSIASRITVDPVSACWIIGGNLDKDGYAWIHGQGAHRVVYKLLVGPIPDDRPQLDHVVKRGCISRACCWPAHLEPVTARTNTLRGNGFAAVNAAKTKCDSGHEFDLYNTYWRLDGHRDCRTCIVGRVKKYQHRLREAAKASDLAAPLELGGCMSPAVTPERLRLAGRAVRVIKENGPLRDADLLAILACEPDELRTAVAITIRWRKVDRCGDFLVAVPPRYEGRPAA